MAVFYNRKECAEVPCTEIKDITDCHTKDGANGALTLRPSFEFRIR